MDIRRLIDDRKELGKYYEEYLERKLLIKSSESKRLSRAHLSKAKHNLEFVQLIEKSRFDDWIIISLYYALYHGFLSLVQNKGHSSKNHNATIIFVMMNYMEIGEEDIEVLERLKISEEDAVFYSMLKDERNKASYSTKMTLNPENRDEIIRKVKGLILKIENIVQIESDP